METRASSVPCRPLDSHSPTDRPATSRMRRLAGWPTSPTGATMLKFRLDDPIVARRNEIPSVVGGSSSTGAERRPHEYTTSPVAFVFLLGRLLSPVQWPWASPTLSAK